MTRLVLLAASAAALCLPAADETDAKPLFWLHAPKTGSSLREFLVDYSCGPPARHDGHRSQAAADLALTRRLERCARNASAPRPFDEKSFKYHKSFFPKFEAPGEIRRRRNGARGAQEWRRGGDAPYSSTNACAHAGVAMLREPRARLASAFFMKGKDSNCMGLATHPGLPKKVTTELCARFRALPEAEALREYAKRSEVRNVQTKMILGIYRYADRADASLDVAEAIRRLRECFPFVGLQERWVESLWLFSRTMRGAAPFSAARAAVNTRPGAYDREIVRHLGDYVDRDTELYAAAVQIYEERLAVARQGKACI